MPESGLDPISGSSEEQNVSIELAIADLPVLLQAGGQVQERELMVEYKILF